MKPISLTRLCLGVALAVWCNVTPALARKFEPAQPPPRVERREARQAERAAQSPRPPQSEPNHPPQSMRPQQPSANRPAQPGANRPGVEQWMERHKTLSPDEQRRQLQNESGFRELPSQMQQRELNELNRLQQMSPEQRNRRGALLKMSPPQRQQFTAAMQQYTALPPNRRQMVRRAFAMLRAVPAPQRPAAINSYPIMQGLTPQERQTLSNLLTWEPYFADGTPGAQP